MDGCALPEQARVSTPWGRGAGAVGLAEGGCRGGRWAEGVSEVSEQRGGGMSREAWAEGAVGRGPWGEGAMGRVSNRIEGAQRPFGCERSEPSCPGPGSAERSAAERGPNSTYFIIGLSPKFRSTYKRGVLI